MLSYPRVFRSFHRDVRLYMAVLALLGMGVFGGISVVLLNIYLLRLGYGPEIVGAVNSVGQLTLAAFALPAASLGRRFGSRPMILVALVLIAVGNALVPLAESFQGSARLTWLLVTPVLGSLGLSVLLVNEKPFLMSVTTPGERNHVYSMQGALYPLSSFVGSVAGGVLPLLFASSLGVGLESPIPYRYPLLISAGLVVVAFVVMRQTQGLSLESAGEAAPTFGRAPVGLVWVMSLVVFAQVAGEVASRVFFNVYLDQGLGVTTATIGSIVALAQFVAIPAALAMPFLAGRWGLGPTFVLSTIGMVVSVLPLAFVPDWRAAGFGYVGIVAFGSVARTCAIVFQLELVRSAWRGFIIGGTTLAFGLSSTLVSIAGGFLIATIGYGTLFLGAGLLSLVGVGLFHAYFRVPRGEYAAVLDSHS